MIREIDGVSGALIQVFVPTVRTTGDIFTVKHGQVLRMSADGRYEMNGDGIKVPFTAGMTMGIPFGVEEIELYDWALGDTLTAQLVEIM